MDQVKYSLHFFLTALGIGTYFFTPLVSTKLTGPGFLKLVLSILVGTLTASFCVGYFINPFFSLSSYLLYAAALLLTLFVMRNHEDEPSILMINSRYLLAIILIALGYTFHGSLISFSYYMLTLLFLGVCNYTMVLGHYYLVVPKLTEKPLLVCMKWLWFLMALKIILASYSTFTHPEYFISGTEAGFGYIFNWIAFLMRFLWGFLALGILSYFGYRLSAMRSIQSATGIFYIMVFFIFIGELISIYTFYETGVML